VQKFLFLDIHEITLFFHLVAKRLQKIHSIFCTCNIFLAYYAYVWKIVPSPLKSPNYWCE